MIDLYAVYHINLLQLNYFSQNGKILENKTSCIQRGMENKGKAKGITSKKKQKGDPATNRGRREKRIKNEKPDLNSETGISKIMSVRNRAGGRIPCSGP